MTYDSDKFVENGGGDSSNGYHHHGSTPQMKIEERNFQIVVPVYNEGDNVIRLYEELLAARADFDSLKFVYDFEADTTIPFIDQLKSRDQRVVAEKNEFGRGVVNALRWGCSKCRPGPVVVVMGDCSDKLSLLPEMVCLWEQGATVVCPSRYMRGGKQYGGGLVKSTLSRVAGVSLRVLGFPTADATNNFKLYDGEWLRSQTIESVGGFEIALELSYKAFLQERKIVELPTEWRDRTDGESKFQLVKWLPLYIKWYLLTLRAIFQRHFRNLFSMFRPNPSSDRPS